MSLLVSSTATASRLHHNSHLHTGSMKSRPASLNLPAHMKSFETTKSQQASRANRNSSWKREEEGEEKEGTRVDEGVDFLTMILQQLRKAEEREKLLRKQLSEMIVENELLRNENGDFRAHNHTPDDTIDELSRLRQENVDHKNQIREMEHFLRDYGLEWVGYTGEEEEGDHNDDTKIELSEKYHLQCYHLFLSKIEELNHIIRSEPAQIITDSVRRRGNFVHSSEICETISIVYYKNGLLVQRGPFRFVGIKIRNFIHFDRMENVEPFHSHNLLFCLYLSTTSDDM